MTMDYIRKTYGVPAKRGGRVTYRGAPGKIIGTRGQYLRVVLDGTDVVLNCHPTWHIEYLPENKP